MGDDHAVHVIPRQHGVAAAGELQPDLVIHILAGDVGDLFAGQLGNVPELRHGTDEVGDGDPAAQFPQVAAGERDDQ